MKNIVVKNKPVWTTQRDNYDRDGHPEFSNQCMIESFTYFWRWLWKTFFITETFLDDRAYYAIVLNSLKSGETRYDWEVHLRITNDYLMKKNIPARLTLHKTNESWKDVLQSIVKGNPVVMSIDIRSALNSKTRKGHIVFLAGLSVDDLGEVRGIYILDPYGSINTNYRDQNGDMIFIQMEKAIKLIDESSHCAILEIDKIDSNTSGGAQVG